MVLNNGSDANKRSQHTTHQILENVKFGGALNVTFDYFLNNTDKYDSLMFMNNDLIVHGAQFVAGLRRELFENQLHIVSPCILEPHEAQCYWKTMYNWGTNTTRIVPWIDFQCPMFHGEFVEKVQGYDPQLQYGWGNDFFSGMICKDNGWKIGVADMIPAIHLANYTINKFKSHPANYNYNEIADANMHAYFRRINRYEEFLEMRTAAHEYQHNSVLSTLNSKL
jgi:hypothetical protein